MKFPKIISTRPHCKPAINTKDGTHPKPIITGFSLQNLGTDLLSSV